MFLASVGAPERYVEALSGYAKKRKEREKVRETGRDRDKEGIREEKSEANSEEE